MKRALSFPLLLLLVLVGSAVVCSSTDADPDLAASARSIDHFDIVSRINTYEELGYGLVFWNAKVSPLFSKLVVQEIMDFLSTASPVSNLKSVMKGFTPTKSSSPASTQPVPSSFETNPHCMHSPIAQDGFGSAAHGVPEWAMVLSSVLEDRICLADLPSRTKLLFPSKLARCFAADICHGPGETCYAGSVWAHLSDATVMERCYAQLADSNPFKRVIDPSKRFMIDPSSQFQPGILNAKGIGLIQQEILEHGPVMATLRVYPDLFHYNEGVYHHVPPVEGADDEVLGHVSAKVVGWGVDSGVPYWSVYVPFHQNWPAPGQKGYARIYRGVDECGIESGVSAGVPVAGVVKKPKHPTLSF